MPPSIYTGDSGETATAVYVWGIGHPTGFPTYIILAKLFSYLLPWLEFAYRLNIFSALVSSATIVIFLFILRKLEIGYLASLAALFSLSFAYTFWLHAEMVQVYSLTAFFIALTILIVLYWLETRKNIYFYLLAIISGIGTGTHLTFLLIFPFIFIFIFARDKKLITAKRLFLFFITFLVVASAIYSYIPLRAAQSPAFNWGNPSNKENFIDYIMQRDWSYKIGNRNLESWKLMLDEIGRLFSREFTWLGLIFISVGVVSAYKKYQSFFYAGFAVIFFNILLMGNYGNSRDIFVLWRYFLPSYIVMAVFLAIGLNIIFDFFWGAKKDNLTILKILLASLLPVFIFFSHFNNVNHRNNFLVQRTVRDIFEILPQKSVFFVGGDTFFGAAEYERLVLGRRQDILFINEYFFTMRLWYREQKKIEIKQRGLKYADNISDFIKNNQDTKFYFLVTSDLVEKTGYDFHPQGIIYEYETKNQKERTDIIDIKKINDKFWQSRNLEFLKNSQIDREKLANDMPILYMAALNNFGTYLVNNGFVEEGIAYFKKTLDIRENNIAESKNALYYLMIIYNTLGEQEKALYYKNRLDIFIK
ncbi:MAG: DUF2723 domain-containing protein [bacterium]